MTEKEKALDTLVRYLLSEFGDFFRVDDMPDEQAPDEAIKLISELRQCLHDVMAIALIIVQMGNLNKNIVVGRFSGKEMFDGDFVTLSKQPVRDLLNTMIEVKVRLGERPITKRGS
jgi:hypothetical protein